MGREGPTEHSGKKARECINTPVGSRGVGVGQSVLLLK